MRRRVGSLLGTLLIAYLSHYPHKARLQLITGVVFGSMLLGFALGVHVHLLLPAPVCLFVTGTAGDAYMALNSTLIIMNSEEAVYGRVRGVYMMAQSIRPITVLPNSAVADAIGTAITEPCSGGIVVVFVLGVALLYPGYRRIGREEHRSALQV